MGRGWMQGPSIFLFIQLTFMDDPFSHNIYWSDFIQLCTLHNKTCFVVAATLHRNILYFSIHEIIQKFIFIMDIIAAQFWISFHLYQ